MSAEFTANDLMTFITGNAEQRGQMLVKLLRAMDDKMDEVIKKYANTYKEVGELQTTYMISEEFASQDGDAIRGVALGLMMREIKRKVSESTDDGSEVGP